MNTEQQTHTAAANSVLRAALEFRNAGISVIPIRADGSKASAVAWKEYQSRLATKEELLSWFVDAQGLAVITGSISGNLEMLELEGRAVESGLFNDARELAYNSGLEDVWDILARTYHERTPSGGIHWLYKISDAPVPKNTKLARRPGANDTVDVLIETRGEGGYVIVAPSHGATHASERAWVNMNDTTVASIATITFEQREALHDVFKALDAMPRVEAIAQTVSTRDTSSSALRPGDDYNERANWQDILIGWTRVYQLPDGQVFWRRPGKSVGVSASTHANDADNLWVFTTSTTFESEKYYSKFAAYAHLKCGDDYKRAAADLAKMGYGTPALQLVKNDTTHAQLTPLADALQRTHSDAQHTDEQTHTDEDEDAQRRALLFAHELETQRIKRDVRQHLQSEEILATFRTPSFTLSAREELQQPDEETQWLVNQLFPTGANILLTAAYKSGKTTMVNNLVKSLVDDEPFLNRYGVDEHTGRVTIFNYEVEPRQYRQWLREMNIQNLDKITLVHLRGLRMPLLAEHVEEKIVEILQQAQTQTWILDPFARAFVGSGEENSNSDVGRFLDTLDVIKSKAGVSNLVMPAHTGRAQEHGIERARGATRLDDHADVRWILTKHESGDRFFSASGRDVELEEQLLTFDEDTRKMSIGKATTRKAHTREKIETKILDYIRTNPQCKSGDIEAHVGGNAQEFRAARDILLRNGLIKYDGIGATKLWSTTDVQPFTTQKWA